MTHTPQIDLRVSPQVAHNTKAIIQELAKKLNCPEQEITAIKVIKRSIDARKPNIKFQLRLLYSTKTQPITFPTPKLKHYNTIQPTSAKVHIIGSGPAGLFAALRCLELGLKPIVIERGKDVRSRRRDLAKLNKEHLVNAESNYCFGEGGAGTYSDGKLYTRSGKRGSINRILETFVQFGADEDILVDAHPHIGTNKLPKIIAKMRQCIIDNGGEIHFETKLTNLFLNKSQTEVEAIELNHNKTVPIQQLVLATGHSARDIFYLLEQHQIKIEAKSFAMGVRVEHPQEFIDQLQYHAKNRGDYLPPSSYSLVQQVNDKGVYSFCMCPGGIIAPCATAPGEVVTNGWSPSKRNNPFANSGIVMTVDEEQWSKFEAFGELKALKFQEHIEKKCFELAGQTQAAPAQRLIDFVANRTSTDLPTCSYQPGLVSVNMNDIFPPKMHQRLREAFIKFDKKMKGFIHPEAVIVATESRTSSPVRIPRNRDTLQHIDLQNLFPCGEGAGYAGGIVSAAIDGERCAEAIFNKALK